MKKSYLRPNAVFINVKNEDIIATSPGFSDGETLSGDAKGSYFDEEEY